MAFLCSAGALDVWLPELKEVAVSSSRKWRRPSDGTKVVLNEDDENAMVRGSKTNTYLPGIAGHVCDEKEDVAEDKKLDSTMNSMHDRSNLDKVTNNFENRAVVLVAIHDDGTDWLRRYLPPMNGDGSKLNNRMDRDADVADGIDSDVEEGMGMD